MATLEQRLQRVRARVEFHYGKISSLEGRRYEHKHDVQHDNEGTESVGDDPQISQAKIDEQLRITAEAALRKNPFDISDVAVHIVVEKKGGMGAMWCDWGNHMPGVDDIIRRGLLESEGCRFDKNGRVLGSRVDFVEFEGDMRGTEMEKYIDQFTMKYDRSLWTRETLAEKE
ncbi:hypothetical protein BDV95DRAFT_595395 [Massariosphaeria phaeospora]|uniref:Uncharacterized protein n=1 Tax=Massariosphaeria phaeospora TaxID=100035 RepID=A0A7C8MMV6_9PLEO|nr:hypothetical protein BDV95DRAFT_595395 [Massariosphaeria phaeospora]